MRFPIGAVLAATILAIGIPSAYVLRGSAEPQDGLYTVTRIIDGDTIAVAELEVSVRLDGFDAPESTPGNWRCDEELAAGIDATRALTMILITSDWTVELHNLRFDDDRYGRASARAYADDIDVASVMVNLGFARPYDGGRRGDWCE